MRKPIAVFVAAFATVAGGGLAMALEAPPETVPPSPPVPEDSPALEQQHPRGEDPAHDTVEVVEDVAEVVEEVETEEVETESLDAAEHPDNHGAWVSDHAQNVCVEQTEVAFGECVSAAARDKDHDGTPDHGPGSDEVTSTAGAGRPAEPGSQGRGRAAG